MRRVFHGLSSRALIEQTCTEEWMFIAPTKGEDKPRNKKVKTWITYDHRARELLFENTFNP